MFVASIAPKRRLSRGPKVASGRSFRPTAPGSDSGPATRSRKCRWREDRPPRSPACRKGVAGVRAGETTAPSSSLARRASPRCLRPVEQRPRSRRPTPSRRERHLLPYTLPGGRELLFTTVISRDWETANVVLLSLDSGERRVLIPGGADARYVSTGHLVFMKTGTLMAVPFDVRSRQVTGTPVTLVEGVMQGVERTKQRSSKPERDSSQCPPPGPCSTRSVASVQTCESSWVWVDRTGGCTRHLTAAPAGPVSVPATFARWKKVAVNVRRGASRTADVWVYDVLRGAPTRLTFDGFNSWPVWSPGRQAPGLRIKYERYFQPLSDQRGWQRQTRAARDQRLRADSIVMGDRRRIDRVPAATSKSVPMESGSFQWRASASRRLFLESRFSLTHPEFSPDGRWIAYVSNESGNR